MQKLRTRWSWLLFPACAVAFVQSSDPSGQSQSRPDPVAAGEADVEATVQALELDARRTPRDTFDPQAVLELAGRDPKGLFEFVRDRTWWVPYAGALRGPTGVLMDRVGNSLDRSLCLAALLRSAGYEARLAEGALSEPKAREIAGRLRPVPEQRLPAARTFTAAEHERAVVAEAERLALEPAEVEKRVGEVRRQHASLAADVLQRTEEQADQLQELLGKPGPGPATGEPWRSLLDHWWVQRKVAETGAWEDLDPLLPDAKPGTSLCESTKTWPWAGPVEVLPVPAELCHRLAVRIGIDVLAGGKLAPRTVFSHELRPAELIGVPISITFHPLDWPDEGAMYRDPEPIQRFRAACIAQTEWLPVLKLGARILEQSSFTLQGVVNEKPAIDPLKRTGAAVRGKMEKAADLLSALEPAQDGSGEVVAVWIDYEIAAPAGAKSTRRREVFDLLAPAERGQEIAPERKVTPAEHEARALALRGKTNLLPTVATLSPEFVLHRCAEMLVENRAALRDVARATGDPDRFARSLGKLRPLPGLLLSLALGRSQLGAHLADCYQDGINLFCEEASFVVASDGSVAGRHGFDIVENRVAVRSATKSDPRTIALRQGVTDTVVEARVLSRDGNCANVSELMAVSPAQSVAWRLVKAAGDESFAKLDASAAARTRMSADLAAGFQVLAPERAVAIAGKPVFGWWRFDPRTGQTLGILESGRGQSMTEYAMILGTGVLAFFGCAGKNPGKNSTEKNNACFACAAIAALAAVLALELVAASALGAAGGAFAGRGALAIAGSCNFISAFTS